ncbi:hypothetical protein SAMN05216570_0957 [Dyella sp. OK004]|nr:hypothetical protein SAMN05216570_0957 [Dyella sp. OK004]
MRENGVDYLDYLFPSPTLPLPGNPRRTGAPRGVCARHFASPSMSFSGLPVGHAVDRERPLRLVDQCVEIATERLRGCGGGNRTAAVGRGLHGYAATTDFFHVADSPICTPHGESGPRTGDPGAPTGKISPPDCPLAPTRGHSLVHCILVMRALPISLTVRDRLETATQAGAAWVAACAAERSASHHKEALRPSMNTSGYFTSP